MGEKKEKNFEPIKPLGHTQLGEMKETGVEPILRNITELAEKKDTGEIVGIITFMRKRLKIELVVTEEQAEMYEREFGELAEHIRKAKEEEGEDGA